jgi:methionyl-tRNA synthetase
MDIKKIQEKINSNDFSFNIKDFLSLIDSQNVNENLLFLEKVFLFCKSKIDNEIKKINKIDTEKFNFSKYQECVEVVNHILKLAPNLNIKKVLPNLKTPIKQRISFLRRKLRQ